MNNEKCDLCGLAMIFFLKKSVDAGTDNPYKMQDCIAYCPSCDKELIPKEFRYMAQREISMIELKKELAEMIEPVVKKIELFILWLENPIQWMIKHQIKVYQAFIIIMIALCLFSYHLSKTSLNLANELHGANKKLIQANESLIESNDELLRINQTLIIYLYHNYDTTSHTVTDEMLDSVFTKQNREDSI